MCVLSRVLLLLQLLLLELLRLELLRLVAHQSQVCCLLLLQREASHAAHSSHSSRLAQLLCLLAPCHLVLHLGGLVLLPLSKLLLKVGQVEALGRVSRLELLLHGILLALKIGECLAIRGRCIATRHRLVVGLETCAC